jgi:hypothetical protein
MTRLKLILSLVALSAFVLVGVLQYGILKKLRTENKVLRGQLDDLSPAIAAQTGATADAENSSAHEQLSELLKLRGEITQLREQTNQVGALKEANQKLAASLKELEALRADTVRKKGPDDALPQDIHPRNSWAFRGYATPEATIESLFWAMVNSDAAAIVEAHSPDEQVETQKMLAKMQERMNDSHFAADEADFATRQKNISEFRILDRRQISDDKIVVTIYLTTSDADGKNVEDTAKSVFQKIAGQWKLTNHVSPND